MATATPKTAGKLHATVHTLDASVREKSVTLLQGVLYDTLDAVMFVKQAHWNCKGKTFIGFHELLDQVYDVLANHSDAIAERIAILGGQAVGTSRAVAAASRLADYPADEIQIDKHVALLSERLAALGTHLREGIAAAGEAGDEDTADLFTEVSRDVEKQTWFIEAHQQG
ncbi:MAG: DNA starvation/stationary phase protection protein Dps [Planctomycetota bacterium]